jgi:hypothetical protein
VSRESSVGIATRYELGGPGIEFRWGARFSAPVQTVLGAYTMDIGSFPGVKRPEAGVGHPLPSSTEVKENVELYLYSLSGPSQPVLGRTILYFYFNVMHVAVHNSLRQFVDHWTYLATRELSCYLATREPASNPVKQ